MAATELELTATDNPIARDSLAADEDRGDSVSSLMHL